MENMLCGVQEAGQFCQKEIFYEVKNQKGNFCSTPEFFIVFSLEHFVFSHFASADL